MFCFCFAREAADGVVAVVGDYSITKSSVLQSAQMFLVQQGKQSFSSQKELDFLLKESLESLVNQRVLFEKAKQDTDIVVSNDEVSEYIENHVNNLILQQGSKENLETALGQTISSFKKESWEDVFKLIITERFQQKILSRFDVSIKDVKDFYYNKKDSLPIIPKQYKFSLIDIPIEAGEITKNKIYSFLINLKDSINISSFEKNAKIHSDDPGSSFNGGDLGYIQRGTLVKEYEKAAFNLKIGEISNPVLSPFGYHLILLVDKKGEKIHTKHILKTFNASKEDKKQAENELKKVYSFLEKKPNLFDSLAIAYSKNKNNLSNVYELKYINELDENIINELNILKENTISFPIEKEKSFQLIKLYIKKEEKTATLLNSWSLLKNMAYQEKVIKELEKLINVYKSEIYIKYYN